MGRHFSHKQSAGAGRGGEGLNKLENLENLLKWNMVGGGEPHDKYQFFKKTFKSSN